MTGRYLLLALCCWSWTPALAEISPACWNEPRMVHSGSPPAEFANRIRLHVTEAPLALPSPVISPGNTYRFALRQPDTSEPGPWHGALQISGGESNLLISFDAIAQPLSPRWLTDELVFVRVAWGRIQFSDLVIDAARGELVFHELVVDGSIEFQQYRQSCSDPEWVDSRQCQCPAGKSLDDLEVDRPLPMSHPAADELLGLLALPGLFDYGAIGGPQLAQPLEPLALRASPGPDAEVIAMIDDPQLLVTREYSYEAPAAVVLERKPAGYRIALASGDSGWVAVDDAGHFMGLDELLPGRLAYLTPAWDGGLWTLQTLAGKSHWQRLRIGDLGRKPAITVDEVRETSSGAWLRIGIYDSQICTHTEPEIRWRGWVPAYSAEGRLTAWFYSRGC